MAKSYKSRRSNYIIRKKYLCSDNRYYIVIEYTISSQLKVILMDLNDEKIYAKTYNIPSVESKYVDWCVLNFCEYFIKVHKNSSDKILQHIAQSFSKVTTITGLVIWPKHKRNPYHSYEF